MSKGHKLKHHVGLCFTCKTEFTLAPLALYTTTSIRNLKISLLQLGLISTYWFAALDRYRHGKLSKQANKRSTASIAAR